MDKQNIEIGKKEPTVNILHVFSKSGKETLKEYANVNDLIKDLKDDDS
jgi:hypothetical protein